MGRIWFHIPSMDRTIDLQFVSEIVWNTKRKKDEDFVFVTIVVLGTSMVKDKNIGILYNEISLCEDADRQVLRNFFPDIPVTFHLNSACEDIDAYVGEAVLDRYKDPEEFRQEES